MPAVRLVAALLTLACATAFVLADKAVDLAQALERRAEKAAREVGPAVACIYVSRSPAYETAPLWGIASQAEHPGQLGRFDAEAAREKVSAKTRHRARILRTIGEHDLSDPDIVPESYGSGLVIDKAGLVLTCAHVVKNATRLYVRLPGGRGSWADIHASDPRCDLAVLKLLDPPADLAAFDVGKGAEVSRGQFLLCLSNGYAPGFKRGDGADVSYGTVRNLRKAVRVGQETDLNRNPLSHYGILLETDARLAPGCSGGVLLNLDGKVVGLTTAVAGVRGEQPGGMAMPIDATTVRLIDSLRKGEEIEYGFLGVVLEKGGFRQGVYIRQASPGSPAGRAGLQGGDQVARINGKEVRDENDLFLYLGMNLANNPAKIEVIRQGRTVTVNVRLGKFYVAGPIIASNRPPAKFGLRVDHLSLLTQRNLFWQWSRMPTSGVIIREVVPGSPADKAKLQPDKVITHVNGTPVQSPPEYYLAMAKTTDKVSLTYLDSNNNPAEMTLESRSQ